MKPKTSEEMDKVDRLARKLDGIAAKLEVMGAAYQEGGGTPAPDITEAALLSLADEVREAYAAFRDLCKA